jgi:phosphatidylglycerophosphatase A
MRLPRSHWHPAVVLATGFGVGLAPVAPGTCAALAALLAAWPIRTACGLAGLAVAVALVFGLGCWAADLAAKSSGVADPGWVVLDEIAGQWATLLAAPLDPLAFALAFVLFRLFDIWKPWPVGWADRHVKGGFGIMLDDLLAAGYAALVLKAALATGSAFGVHI